MTEHLYEETKALREALKAANAERDRIALQLKTESHSWHEQKKQFEEARHAIEAERDLYKAVLVSPEEQWNRFEEVLRQNLDAKRAFVEMFDLADILRARREALEP